jgi:hypothetical protein
MKASWTGGLLLALAVGLVAGLMIAHHTATAVGAAKEEGAAGGGARYNVVDTEGHNLIVTDNKTNTLYFYTVDKGKEVGSELKLRGTLDLTQIGEPVLKPKTHAVEK